MVEKFELPEAHHPATSSTASSGGWVGTMPFVCGEQTLEQWNPQRFRFVALLQEAPRNSGRVELCEDRETSQMVAVKAMPMAWACSSHEAFLAAHPEENELPWQDSGAIRYLSRDAGLECVCTFIGLFRRVSGAHGEEVCLVLSYCSGGDLFSWLDRGVIVTSPDREAAARPLMRKVLEAVRDIHALGVAHGDLSLENVLLHTEATNPEDAEVRLIDFGACTGERAIGLRGKPSYQAPEVHVDKEYSAFAVDAFAAGVMLFTLAIGNFPWRSTRPQVCPCFRFAAERGLVAYLGRRKVKSTGPEGYECVVSLAELLSGPLVDLLAGLLAAEPEKRLTVSAALQHTWFLGNAESQGGEVEE